MKKFKPQFLPHNMLRNSLKQYDNVSPQISMFRNAFMETDDAKHIIRHYISSDQVNDYRQLLDPKKYEDKMYRMNPIVLFEHGGSGYFGAASVSESLKYKIGKNNKVWVETKNNVVYLAGETEFRNDSDEAQDIYNLYKNGFMNAWSKFIKPIGKPKWDDENNMIIYDTWTQREYSAVDLPVDGFAVGSETSENALSMVKSEMMKHRINAHAIEGSITKDFTLSSIKADIELLKNKLNSTGELNHGMTKDEITAEVKKAFNSYTETLIPKLKEMFNSQNTKLNKLSAEVETIAANAAAKLVFGLMGATVPTKK